MSEFKMNIARSTFDIGTIIAVVVSWSIHKSVLWAIIHGFLGWLYVIYYLIKPFIVGILY